jgi:predicted DNA-binding transcriptional regulator AlpA
MTDRGRRAEPEPVQADRFVRSSELRERLAIGKDKLDDLIDKGALPPAIKLGSRTSVWLESEVQAFLDRMAKDRRLNTGADA